MVSCILLNLLASIYRFESFTWIPLQILHIHGHFKLRNMKVHVLMIKLIHWPWAACGLKWYSRRTPFSLMGGTTSRLMELWWGARPQWPLRTFSCPELKQIISKSKTQPLEWKRYIDHAFSLWETGREIILQFVLEANTHPRLRSRV